MSLEMGRPKLKENVISIIDTLDKRHFTSTYRLEELIGISQSTV